MPATPVISTLTPATRTVVGLAGDLVLDGAEHPIAAALARAARMRTLADPATFAARLGLDPFTVRRCEAGSVSFGALPAAYLALFDDVAPSVDLVGLRELAEQVDGRTEPTEPSGGLVITLRSVAHHSPRLGLTWQPAPQRTADQPLRRR
ncbi:MAG: hypothetical protein AAGE98_01615 [Actinomycetota bacterium]